MIKKVLIATDGSENSAKAVDIGSDIAAKYDAEVLLVHVLLNQEVPRDFRRLADIEHLNAQIDMRSAIGTQTGVGMADLGSYFKMGREDTGLTADVVRAIGKQILKNAEKSARDHGADRVSGRLEDGKPVDRILDIAKSEKVDLIVSGARGLSEVKSLVLGSVSHKLAQLSQVPCLTVH